MADDHPAIESYQRKDRISILAQRLNQIGFAMPLEAGKMEPPYGGVVQLSLVADCHA